MSSSEGSEIITRSKGKDPLSTCRLPRSTKGSRGGAVISKNLPDLSGFRQGSLTNYLVSQSPVAIKSTVITPLPSNSSIVIFNDQGLSISLNGDPPLMLNSTKTTEARSLDYVHPSLEDDIDVPVFSPIVRPHPEPRLLRSLDNSVHDTIARGTNEGDISVIALDSLHTSDMWLTLPTRAVHRALSDSVALRPGSSMLAALPPHPMNRSNTSLTPLPSSQLTIFSDSIATLLSSQQKMQEGLMDAILNLQVASAKQDVVNRQAVGDLLARIDTLEKSLNELKLTQGTIRDHSLHALKNTQKLLLTTASTKIAPPKISCGTQIEVRDSADDSILAQLHDAAIVVPSVEPIWNPSSGTEIVDLTGKTAVATAVPPQILTEISLSVVGGGESPPASKRRKTAPYQTPGITPLNPGPSGHRTQLNPSVTASRWNSSAPSFVPMGAAPERLSLKENPRSDRNQPLIRPPAWVPKPSNQSVGEPDSSCCLLMTPMHPLTDVSGRRYYLNRCSFLNLCRGLHVPGEITSRDIYLVDFVKARSSIYGEATLFTFTTPLHRTLLLDNQDLFLKFGIKMDGCRESVDRALNELRRAKGLTSVTPKYNTGSTFDLIPWQAPDNGNFTDSCLRDTMGQPDHSY